MAAVLLCRNKKCGNWMRGGRNVTASLVQDTLDDDDDNYYYDDDDGNCNAVLLGSELGQGFLITLNIKTVHRALN